jgi:hypothetical protein
LAAIGKWVELATYVVAEVVLSSRRMTLGMTADDDRETADEAGNNGGWGCRRG